MKLKGCLHIHTTCSDGELTIAEAVRVYESLGYDFIALTDHDYMMRPGCYDQVNQLVTNMIVFTGAELTVFERGYCHINRIKGNEQTLHIFNHPAALGLSPEKLAARISLVSERLPIDAMEITDNGYPTPEFDLPEIELPKVAADDSHTLIMCGRAWIELDSKPDKDAIIRAVKNGDFRNCFNR